MSDSGALAVAFAVGTVLLCEAALLITGSRVLIGEQRIPPGEMAKMADWGDVYGDSLICTHFTGRSVTKTVYTYSPNDVMGRSECPFIYKPKPE
jgi:hypothetical protein